MWQRHPLLVPDRCLSFHQLPHISLHKASSRDLSAVDPVVAEQAGIHNGNGPLDLRQESRRHASAQISTDQHRGAEVRGAHRNGAI